MEELKREVKVRPAFDRRSPEPSKNYGIHGAEMAFYLTGSKGVIQFIVYTNWQLPHVRRETDSKPCNEYTHRLFLSPTGTDVGYHSYVPMYKDQTPLIQECPLLGGKPCYYDGSGLLAEEWLEILIAEGDEKIWTLMEQEYHGWFDNVVPA